MDATSNEIRADGQFTLRDLLTGHASHWRAELIFVSLAGIAAIIFAVVKALTGQWQTVPYLLLFVVWLLIYPLMIIFRYRSSLKKSPVYHGLINYKFSDHGFELESPHFRSDLAWSGFVKWREGKHTFLLYTTPKQSTFVPKRFFPDSAAVDSVRRMLQANVPTK